jgi:hypothetical protein
MFLSISYDLPSDDVTERLENYVFSTSVYMAFAVHSSDVRHGLVVSGRQGSYEQIKSVFALLLHAYTAYIVYMSVKCHV